MFRFVRHVEKNHLERISSHHRGKSLHVRDVKNKRKHNVLETRSQMSSAQLGLKYIMIHQAGKSEYGRFPQTIYGDIGQ
jgi:hypothetical protein